MQSQLLLQFELTVCRLKLIPLFDNINDRLVWIGCEPSRHRIKQIIQKQRLNVVLAKQHWH